ncbi:ROK family transcriptional regulator [Sulfitobacter sabulilitoris]|uniref:ROK family transcriptional regulator n=1 Tax=Sulfitobacter sabulilitoris TaxID=2562655 RepID=A0A5S3PM51_9RHOB|nr:ROK family transcriptional regulator [Sulfitobacter sabulilitoris]TMM55431.1 ROK family transcriptional regulator [Sulfitobacter sabulilitoris]
MNETTVIRALSNGVNQKGVRNHNERLILSVLQRHGDLSGSDIARRTHLSAQTVSVILRKLEQDDLVRKGRPTRGKIGKPSVPMALNPGGALSVGFKLGRRGSELFLMNLCGEVLFERRITYDIAIPEAIFAFMRDSFEDALSHVGPVTAQKLCGIGIALPFEIWKWGTSDGNTPQEFLRWKDIVFEDEVARFTDLPVFMVNDATSACWAEHVHGRGKEFRDYAYFFISTFIGGGIVINQSVYEGARGNAGALGSLRVGDRDGHTRQLIDVASIHVLEATLQRAGHDPRGLWAQPQDWSAFEPHVSDWIETTANEVAQACLSACAIIDFEAIVIAGACPADVRARLVAGVRARLPQQDSRGLILPRIEEGAIGGEARAIGAACGPIYAQYFLTAHPGPPD